MVGDVRVPTDGWQARLTRRSPQGINPKILILDVNTQQPGGEAQEASTTIPLRYEESPPQDEYGQVMIANGKAEIVVRVCGLQLSRGADEAADGGIFGRRHQRTGSGAACAGGSWLPAQSGRRFTGPCTAALASPRPSG